MPATVIYNSSQIIPAPLLSIQKNYIRTGTEDKLAPEFTLVLTGTLLSYMGSPRSDGSFSSTPADENLTESEKNRSIRTKQDALRKLFGKDGLVLQIANDGYEILKCNPIVESIEFEGNGTEVWVDLCRYTITLKATKITASNGVLPVSNEDDSDLVTTSYYLQDASESWEVDFDKTVSNTTLTGSYPVYNVTHTISATGKVFYNEDASKVAAIDSARAFCKSRMGFNSTKVTTDAALSIATTGLTAYDHQRESTEDTLGGSYSITETWKYTNVPSTNPCLYTLTAEISRNRKQNPSHSIVINGTIQGLDNTGSLINTNQRYTNAIAFLKANVLADTSTGTFPGLNILFVVVITNFLNNSMGTTSYTNFSSRLNFKNYTSIFRHDPENGTISFTFDFSDEPENLIPGALSESINITDQRSARIVAQQPVINRGLGPILQDMNTYTASTRNLDIELVMQVSSIELKTGVSRLNYIYLNSKPNTDSLVAQFIPSSTIDGLYTNNYRENDTESYDIKNGQYRRSVSWIYQPCSLPAGQTLIAPQY